MSEWWRTWALVSVRPGFRCLIVHVTLVLIFPFPICIGRMRHQFHRVVVGLNEMTETKGALYILLIIMMYFVLTVYYSINSASLYMPCLRVASNNSAIRKRVHETRICEAFILLLSQILPSNTVSIAVTSCK